MNPKLLIKISFAIALFVMVVGCGGSSPEPAPTEAAVAQVPVEAATPTPVKVPPQTPAAGFTPEAICRVPDIVGLDVLVAKSTLAAVGLQPVENVQHDESVATNAIISQEPPAKTMLKPCEGYVDILVSLGPAPVPTDIPPPTETPSPTDTPAPPTETPTLTPVPPTVTPEPPSPTPTPRAGLITFASPSDPNALNPILGWQPGGSTANAYDLTLNSEALTVIAGAGADQWWRKNSAPLVIYPFTGNFEAQVKVIFNPDRNWQAAGLGVRSAQDSLTWMRLVRVFNDGNGIRFTENKGNRTLIFEQIPYQKHVTYLKINRRNTLFTASYSENGKNWVDLKTNYVSEIGRDVQIYLVTLSNSKQGISAQFSDFIVEPRP